MLTLKLPQKFYEDPRLVSLATRLKISPSAEYAYLSALLQVIILKFLYKPIKNKINNTM